MTVTYAPIQRRKTLNVRLIVFLIVACSPVAIALYSFLSYNGGITHHGNYDEVDLKAMGNFQFDQQTGTTRDVPERWRGLDGKRVELKGYMWDPQSAGDEHIRFQFVYNVAKCCFNGPPLVQERIFAQANYGVIPADMNFGRLIGVLHVNVVRDKSGAIQAVYTLDVEKAETLG